MSWKYSSHSHKRRAACLRVVLPATQIRRQRAGSNRGGPALPAPGAGAAAGGGKQRRNARLPVAAAAAIRRTTNPDVSEAVCSSEDAAANDAAKQVPQRRTAPLQGQLSGQRQTPSTPPSSRGTVSCAFRHPDSPIRAGPTDFLRRDRLTRRAVPRAGTQRRTSCETNATAAPSAARRPSARRAPARREMPVAAALQMRRGCPP